MMTRLSESARSTASTLLSRPTESGRMMYGNTTVSLSGRTGRTSGILIASSCGSPGGLLIRGSLGFFNMQYPSLLPLVLDLGEVEGQQAVGQAGRALVRVDGREDVDLAAEPPVPPLEAVELEALGLGQGGRLGAGDQDARPPHLEPQVGAAEARQLGQDLHRPRRLDDVDRRLPLAERQVALADLQGLREEAVELGLEAGDHEEGFEAGSHDELPLLGLLGLFAGLQQGPDHVHEGVDVLEPAVHRGEAHVGDLVQLLEPLHDEGADLLGRDLPVLALVEHRFGLIDDRLQLLQGDRPLLARLEQAAEELLAAELLARAVVLDDHVGDILDLLVGGEAPAAAQALAAAADGRAVAALPRVDHPVAVFGAKGAPHRALSASPWSSTRC